MIGPTPAALCSGRSVWPEWGCPWRTADNLSSWALPERAASLSSDSPTDEKKYGERDNQKVDHVVQKQAVVQCYSRLLRGLNRVVVLPVQGLMN